MGDRNGARYDFVQMITIVNSIKTWCIETNSRLPNVEALPITIGMINEVEVEEAKQGVPAATREYNLASQRLIKAEREGQDAKLPTLTEAIDEAQDGVDFAEEALEIARRDLEATCTTVPMKRLTCRSGKAGTSDTISTPDVDADEEETLSVSGIATETGQGEPG